MKKQKQKGSQNLNRQGFSSLTISLHAITILLVYAYIKQQLTFNFLYILSPSLIVFISQGYQILSNTKGIIRAKYLISYSLLFIFFIIFSRVIKNQGGIMQDQDDKRKWVVRHRKSFEILLLSMITYVFYDLINHQKNDSSSVVKQVILNIMSSLSTPLTVCSGGACNSIYISTITSILSSFSVPLTLVVPLLNVFGHILQLIGLISLYSTNKWKSISFWIYFIAMLVQFMSFSQLINWISCGMMIIATVINAKTNKFYYGKNKKLFKQSIV